ncbi:hypothetical protein R6Q59_025136 [Mikania micrantha]
MMGLIQDARMSSALTLVLVGKTGNGKSATGNSILGTQSFESRRSSSGVTVVSELKATKLEDGRMLNVIDTPGMFDPSVDPDFIRREIVGCIHMARDGIHAVLVVFSICNRFSEEEQAVVYSLVALFGTKIYDYMIVVFTSGDELEAEGKSLEDFLSGCSQSLKQILGLCGNRCVLFDNRTKDESKKGRQVQQILAYVKMVLENNDWEPYASEMFAELKEFTQSEKLLLTETQLKRLIEMFESKFIEMELKLQKLLEKERAARVKLEKKAREAEKKHEEDIKQLKEELAKAKAEAEAEKGKKSPEVVSKGWSCVIL